MIWTDFWAEVEANLWAFGVAYLLVFFGLLYGRMLDAWAEFELTGLIGWV